MKTIAQVTEDVIRRSPFLAEALYQDIANISELARRIRPQVEQVLYEEVSDDAIAMALRRIKRHVKAPVAGEDVLKDLRHISIRSNLVEFMFPNSPAILDTHQKLLEKTKAKPGSFFNLSTGHLESIVMVSDDLEKDTDAILKDQKNVAKVRNLSAITIQFSDKLTLESLGEYYLILKALAWQGVSVIEIASIGWELNLFFRSSDVDRAFSVIKSLVS